MHFSNSRQSASLQKLPFAILKCKISTLHVKYCVLSIDAQKDLQVKNYGFDSLEFFFFFKDIPFSYVLRLIKHTEKLLEEKEEKLCVKVLRTLREMMAIDSEYGEKVRIFQF